MLCLLRSGYIELRAVCVCHMFRVAWSSVSYISCDGVCVMRDVYGVTDMFFATCRVRCVVSYVCGVTYDS